MAWEDSEGLRELLDRLKEISYVQPDELPNIDDDQTQIQENHRPCTGQKCVDHADERTNRVKKTQFHHGGHHHG